MKIELDPAITKVEFTLPDVLHTVRGTFAMKSGLIHFNPSNGSASSFVLVDVKSGQSGNSTRDRKMHKDILQREDYPDARFTPTKVSVPFSTQGSSDLQVDGTLRIHGGDHPITLVIQLQISGSSANCKTQLVLPYVQWGMKNPSTFVLRVSDKVDLEIASYWTPPTGRAIRAHQGSLKLSDTGCARVLSCKGYSAGIPAPNPPRDFSRRCCLGP